MNLKEAQMSKEPKKVATVRIDVEVLARLNEIAKNTGHTQSTLINMAAFEFVTHYPNGLSGLVKSGTPVVTGVHAEDLKAILPVMEAMGKSIPVGLFLEMMKAQKFPI
jgi:hypothetical protein